MQWNMISIDIGIQIKVPGTIKGDVPGIGWLANQYEALGTESGWATILPSRFLKVHNIVQRRCEKS